LQLDREGRAMNPIQVFMRWWNNLARKNGKLKFRNQREAAEFVRRVQNENGGPNDKILEMRKKYNDINRAKQANIESGRSGDSAVLH
jgi:hypothetical protein